MANRNARKQSAMRGPPGDSRYAKKIKRKCGKGAIEPRWQWWLERKLATTSPLGGVE